MPLDSTAVSSVLPPFAYPPKTFINLSTPRMVVSRKHNLESVRDMVARLEKSQQPVDRVYNLKSLMVRFEDGRPVMRRVIGPNKMSAPIYFNRRGWDMFCSHIFPNTGIKKGYEIQARWNRGPENPTIGSTNITRSEMGATLDFNWWLQSFAPDREILVRTVLTKAANGELERIIRAVQTPSYCPFSDLEYINLILDTDPTIGEAAVIKARIGTGGMWLRLEQKTGIEAKKVGDKLAYTFDFWNSQNSTKKVGRGYGFLILTCANGMTSNKKGSVLEAWHKGNKDVLINALKDNMSFQQALRDGLMADWNKAFDIAIEDHYTWMAEEVIGAGYSKGMVDRVHKEMQDPTSGPMGSLQNVINGMTLLAQNNSF